VDKKIGFKKLGKRAEQKAIWGVIGIAFCVDMSF
jgi:hypothetical protein